MLTELCESSFRMFWGSLTLCRGRLGSSSDAGDIAADVCSDVIETGCIPTEALNEETDAELDVIETVFDVTDEV